MRQNQRQGPRHLFLTCGLNMWSPWEPMWGHMLTPGCSCNQLHQLRRCLCVSRLRRCSLCSVLIFSSSLHSAWGASLCCRPPQPEAFLPNLGPCLECSRSPAARRRPQTASGRWGTRRGGGDTHLFDRLDLTGSWRCQVMNSLWTFSSFLTVPLLLWVSSARFLCVLNPLL